MSGCSKCGKALCRANVTGFCRGCFATNLALSPDREAQRIRTLRESRVKVPADKMSADMKALSAKRMAWCPDSYRAAYRHLTRSKNLPAAAARAVILDQVAADERTRVEALTPFERQMDRLAKAGGRLVDVCPLRRADPTMTLGGVSSGLL